MVTENGMQLKVEEVRHLANVLFTDGCKEGQDHLTLDDFKEQLSRREGLVANLGIMINKWLVPARKKAGRTLVQRVQDKLPRQMITLEYSLHRWILEILSW